MHCCARVLYALPASSISRLTGCQQVPHILGKVFHPRSEPHVAFHQLDVSNLLGLVLRSPTINGYVLQVAGLLILTVSSNNLEVRTILHRKISSKNDRGRPWPQSYITQPSLFIGSTLGGVARWRSPNPSSITSSRSALAANSLTAISLMGPSLGCCGGISSTIIPLPSSISWGLSSRGKVLAETWLLVHLPTWHNRKRWI